MGRKIKGGSKVGLEVFPRQGLCPLVQGPKLSPFKDRGDIHCKEVKHSGREN